MGERGGPTAKDAEITEGFNTEKVYDTDAETKALLKKQKNAQKQRSWYYRHEAKGVLAANGDSDEAKEAYQMLQDMRWVYRQLNGREKLKSLVKSDDRQFVFMVKELMKIEAALLSAKIRAKEDTNGKGDRMVFVVLKGLAEEQQVLEAMDDTVDMKQIASALTPDGEEYVAEGQHDDTVDRT